MQVARKLCAVMLLKKELFHSTNAYWSSFGSLLAVEEQENQGSGPPRANSFEERVKSVHVIIQLWATHRCGRACLLQAVRGQRSQD